MSVRETIQKKVTDSEYYRGRSGDGLCEAEDDVKYLLWACEQKDAEIRAWRGVGLSLLRLIPTANAQAEECEKARELLATSLFKDC